MDFIQINKAVWFQHEGVFKKGTIIQVNQNKKLVDVSDIQKGTTFSNISFDNIFQRSKITEFSQSKSDMVNLEILNDPELKNNLELRYDQDMIYTFIGPTLLAINPFKQIKAFLTEEFKNQYIEQIALSPVQVEYKQIVAHAFSVAAEAYRAMVCEDQNQAIVISGESGAGKTENAKLCMSLITAASTKASKNIQEQVQQDEIPMQDRILNCNPILEAYGNAKTIRNNNSSRFGKYVRIFVDPETKQIAGADIINYLLEKSRLTQAGNNERSFHIFYHFLKGEPTISQFNLPNIEKLNFLNKSNTYDAPNIDDVQLYKEIQQSYMNLGLQSYIQIINNIIAAILLLGQIEFDELSLSDTSPCTIKDQSLLVNISNLLQLTESQLLFSLTMKTMVVSKQTINTPLKLNECLSNRDSVCKDLFDRLFNWLVVKLNETIKPSIIGKKFNQIGLLDIYGFEVFKVNGFEQLMINYTNERLHQLYIDYVFKEELKIFELEGLQLDKNQIKFEDNEGVINLIDNSRTGIFSLLNESCSVSSTDERLLGNIRKAYKTTILVKFPKIPSDLTFTIIHTAKEVEYNILGFRYKNLDEVNATALHTLAKSQNDIIKYCYNSPDNSDKQSKFLVTKIKKQMDLLMQELKSSNVHFIRCIKPNESKLPNLIDTFMILNQIRYLGVLDSLKVRKIAYPIRRFYKQLYESYSLMLNDKPVHETDENKVDFKDLAQKLIQRHFSSVGKDMMLLGNTKVFLRIEGKYALDKIYAQNIQKKKDYVAKIENMIIKSKFRKQVKKFFTTWNKNKQRMQNALYRTRFKKQIAAATKIQQCFRKYIIRKNKNKINSANKIIQKYIKTYYEYRVFLRIQNAEKIKIKNLIWMQTIAKLRIKVKKIMQQIMVDYILNLIINSQWLVVLNKKATIIQKLIRGFICRRKNRYIIKKIKDAKFRFLFRLATFTVQKYARGYLVRRRNFIINCAARFIQGYFKKQILSKWFQKVRKNVRIIQRTLKKYQTTKHYNTLKSNKYMLHYENQLNKLKYQDSLFFHAYRFKNLIQCSQLNISRIQDHEMERTQDTTQMDFSVNLIEKQLIQSSQKKSDKINIFSFLLDIERIGYIQSLTTWNDVFIKQFCSNYEQNPIQVIQVAETYSLIVNQHQRAFTWGELNEQYQNIDQLSTGRNNTIALVHNKIQIFGCQQNGEIEKYEVSSIQDPTHVHASQSQNYVIDSKGLIHVVINDKKIHQPFKISQKANFITSGLDFVVILTQVGTIYTFGENKFGQLGLKHLNNCNQPVQIDQKLLFDEKIIQISSGFAHTVARSASGRVYAWGSNLCNQLAINQKQSSFPIKIQCKKAISICASAKSTVILCDDRKIYWTGLNGTVSYSKKLEQVNLEQKCLEISQNPMRYLAIKVESSWSRTMSLIYIRFADCYQIDSPIQEKQRILEQFGYKWDEISAGSVLGPQYGSILNKIDRKCIKEDNSKQKLQKQKESESKGSLYNILRD